MEVVGLTDFLNTNYVMTVHGWAMESEPDRSILAGYTGRSPVGPEIRVDSPDGAGPVGGGYLLDFGRVDMGEVSQQKQLTITNVGDQPLHLTRIVMGGANPDDFTINLSGSTTLNPHSGRVLSVFFSPSAHGPRSAVIQLFSNDADESLLEVALSGFAKRLPTLTVDSSLRLTVDGSPGSHHTLVSRASLDEGPAWETLANLTLDHTGTAVINLSTDSPGTRFYKRFQPTGLALVAAGSFQMGSPLSELERSPIEEQYLVTLTHWLWMGIHEVTQADYLSVVGSNPSFFKNGVKAPSPGLGGAVSNALHSPVEQVSWSDATNYCALLTRRELASGLIPLGYAYRLPTEAEWEYACRAGSQDSFHFGKGIRQGLANFQSRYEYSVLEGTQVKSSNTLINRPVEVGSFESNPFGLYDMHGNVSEWCSDQYDSYPQDTVVDPQGPAFGVGRVYRGGGWDSLGSECRSASRFYFASGIRVSNIGFRVVLGPVR